MYGGGNFKIQKIALDEFYPGNNETVLSIICARLGESDNPYYAIGTGILTVDESSSNSGRLLIFGIGVHDKLQHKCQKSTDGYVYSLGTIKGLLIAGINSEVCNSVCVLEVLTIYKKLRYILNTRSTSINALFPSIFT